jgi:uncharacterized alkaline shock family protein YloU
MEHTCLAISVASLRTIGNILTGDDNETQVAIDAECLAAFNRLIVHNSKAVRREVCKSISNVTAGSSA